MVLATEMLVTRELPQYDFPMLGSDSRAGVSGKRKSGRSSKAGSREADKAREQYAAAAVATDMVNTAAWGFSAERSGEGASDNFWRDLSRYGVQAKVIF